MEVKVTIPGDLEKYLEFIPKEELPDIFVDIIRENIKSRHDKKRNSKLPEIEEIINLLKNQAVIAPVASVSSIVVGRGEEQEPDTLTESRQNTVDVIDFSDMDDNDLGDFMDLMK